MLFHQILHFLSFLSSTKGWSSRCSLHVQALHAKTSCGFSATASVLSIFRHRQVCVSQLRLWSVCVHYSDTLSPSLSPPTYFSSLQKWQCGAARGAQMQPPSSISSSSPWTHARTDTCTHTNTQSAPSSGAISVSRTSSTLELLPQSWMCAPEEKIDCGDERKWHTACTYMHLRRWAGCHDNTAVKAGSGGEPD